MSNQFNRAIDILRSDRCTLKDLADLAGADASYFYRGCNLEGVDLRGQDLRAISLVGASLVDVLVDHRTQFADSEKRDLPLAINYMRVAFDAVKNVSPVDLASDLLHWLATSAGLLDVNRTGPIKESSPLHKLKDQVHIRIARCVAEIGTYRQVRTDTKLAAYRDTKVLLDLWEVVAFLNRLADTAITFSEADASMYRNWRHQVMREPLPRSLTVYPPGEGLLHDEQYRDVDLYLQLEVVLLGLYLVERRKLKVKELDGVLRKYHQTLFECFPADVAELDKRGAHF